MAKRLVHELSYDAPVADVATMLADPTFREEVCDYQRVISKEVTITSEGSGMRVVIDMVQPARGIPSFAQKFVGDTINIVQSESWSSATTGEITAPSERNPAQVAMTRERARRSGVIAAIIDSEIGKRMPAPMPPPPPVAPAPMKPAPRALMKEESADYRRDVPTDADEAVMVAPAPATTSTPTPR